MRAKYLAFLILTVECLLPGCRRQATTATPATAQELAIPQHGLYTGAYIDFGDTEDDVSLEAIEDFEAMVGKHQAVIASSSYWGEQSSDAQPANHLASSLDAARFLVAVG